MADGRGAPLRVCQIMECTIGGTRRHIGELCRGLAAAGHDVTLIASAERDATFRRDLERIAAAGARVIELPMHRSLGPRDAWHGLRIAAHFLRNRYDIVHTHSSKAGALGRSMARLVRSRARLVHTPHTFAFNFTAQFSPRKRALFLGIERRLGRVTDALVHVGASEREEGQQLGIVPPERAVIIPNGIDPTAYRGLDRTACRRALGVDGDAPLVGAVGLLNEAKGHGDLIDAAAIVRRSRPEVRFVIAGEGALRGALEERIARTEQTGAVRLLGYRDDIPHVLGALDVFCMPSLWEGLPYVVLEAMATGVPVVATDVNGCRDLVGDERTGLLVEKERPEQLAAAILRLLDDPALAAGLASTARAMVDDDYSLDGMVQRTVELYRSVLTRT